MASIPGVSSVQAPLQGVQTIPAKSSWISLFEFDPVNLRLTTHLKNGAIYQHTFFTPWDWEALKTSQFHGFHFNNFIKGKKSSLRVKVLKGPTAKGLKR